ncbi:ubiquitin carboxyl-terminal hydrolase [Coelomomyces lativittatus]|nr:ubiquitin carboxyl-terminal hydrolase [Coelomomyces lativittatus]KAJ1511621.1 ubiquitin carboxyl-terminal hydrolase [Coelomomyces lativittatus]KAJ1515417.1 ubiquitin carboxyl-terminal hydrolase [Coelomomyces lativittatus]
MADSNGNWTLIESDPGVFTELISNFGAKGLEVEELWTITDQTKNEEVFGVIFLFKWEPSAQFVRDVIEWDQVPNVFFAKQVIQNACATQAILSVLMNCPPSVDIGEELQKFKEFTMQLDPDMYFLTF